MLACLASGCVEPREELRHSALSLRYFPDCAPDRLDRLTVEALGHFPASEATIASFDAQSGPGTLAGLPFDARMFRVSLTTPTYRGFALASAEHGVTEDALVLPLGVHCSAPAPFAPPALDAAALALVSGRDVLIAGGRAGVAARREASLVRVDRAEVVAVDAGLFVPRAHACAASVRGEAWVIGGAQDARTGSPALDTFERFEPAQGRFVGLGRLRAPRAGCVALALPQGDVLVAGGRSEVDGLLLRTLELLGASGDASTELAARLPFEGEVVQALSRDDGLVALSLRTAEGPRLALLAPEAEAIEAVAAPEAPWDPALVVALPGARLALFETVDGRTTGTLWLVLETGDHVQLSQWLASFAGLGDARAVALTDGRVLLTGEDRDGPAARVIDVARGDVRVRRIEEVPAILMQRADGSVVELGAERMQLVREDAGTRFDNPGGTLLADDSSVLALDAPAHWTREGLGLIANVALARFDVSALQYERVRIELEVDGPGELLLRRVQGGERIVEVGEDRVGPAFCHVEAEPGEPIHLEREGAMLKVRTRRGSRRCALDGLVGPIALAFRALEPGVRVASLEVTRL